MFKIKRFSKNSIFESLVWDDELSKDRHSKTIANGKKGRYLWVDECTKQCGIDYKNKDNKEVSEEYNRVCKSDKNFSPINYDRYKYTHFGSNLKSKNGRATGEGGESYIGRHRNPFKKYFKIQNYYDAKSNGHDGRDSFIHGITSDKSEKDFYRDFLRMENYKGVNEKTADMSHKEIKDAIRKMAKGRNIEKGLIIGGTGLAGIGGISYGIKKLKDKKRNKNC